ncbi:MAG: hypothetical protein QOE90_3271 [Thermoplasmata archaeon]|jgi:hypothetical protein|nr:hypothetical protein [Thermoplasmata archaeon]
MEEAFRVPETGLHTAGKKRDEFGSVIVMTTEDVGRIERLTDYREAHLTGQTRTRARADPDVLFASTAKG